MSQWSFLYLNLCPFPLVNSLRRVWLCLVYALPSVISLKYLSGSLLDQYVHAFLVLLNLDLNRVLQLLYD